MSSRQLIFHMASYRLSIVSSICVFCLCHADRPLIYSQCYNTVFCHCLWQLMCRQSPICRFCNIISSHTHHQFCIPGPVPSPYNILSGISVSVLQRMCRSRCHGMMCCLRRILPWILHVTPRCSGLLPVGCN